MFFLQETNLFDMALLLTASILTANNAAFFAPPFPTAKVAVGTHMAFVK